jgi:DNA (cytosine-5)-methyltransferase 1
VTSAYYNEHDSKAAAWLRELIKDGLITDGEVDERSIEDVLPADLRRFTRCHFFAGIGCWDYALNNARWPADRRVWTGSCPCQPFSVAGKGEGFADERHLWPSWFHLINVCRPDTLFGEQVSSADGIDWLDLICSDLEGVGYRVGPLDIPAAGVGAPHRRQRLYFVADAGRGIVRDGRFEMGSETRGMQGEKLQRKRLRADARDGDTIGDLADTGHAEPSRRLDIAEGQQHRNGDARRKSAPCGTSGDLDDSAGPRCDGPGEGPESQTRHETRLCGPECGCGVDELGDTIGPRLEGHLGDEQGGYEPGRLGTLTARSIAEAGFIDDMGHAESNGREQGRAKPSGIEGRPDAALAGFTNGFWRDAEWIYCRDGKYRPTKPGLFPLANGIAGRVGLLRGAGNAIVPEAAEAFVRSYLEIEN